MLAWKHTETWRYTMSHPKWYKGWQLKSNRRKFIKRFTAGCSNPIEALLYQTDAEGLLKLRLAEVKHQRDNTPVTLNCQKSSAKAFAEISEQLQKDSVAHILTEDSKILFEPKYTDNVIDVLRKRPEAGQVNA